MPCFSASATTAGAVATPSVTALRPDMMASSGTPRPSAIPQLILRELVDEQVRTRSPSPHRPDSVSAFAPMATPSRAISAKPRVISAAWAEAPRSLPSEMPQAMASTFLTAPPTSAPIRSSARYGRKAGMEMVSASFMPSASSAQASVTAVGRPRATSMAKLGPDRTAAGAPGRISASTSVISLPVSRSIPLAHSTTGAPLPICGAAPSRTLRRCCAGTTASTASQSARSS